ncbi:MAG: hypothetical protein ACM3NV_06225 [Syntrophothermus sp.]
MQLDFAGPLTLADGRYLDRGAGADRVLVVATLGAPAAPPRRWRRPRPVEAGAEPRALPLSRVTAIRAHAPFAAEADAAAWLAEATASEEGVDAAVDEAMSLLNRALHARAVAAADPTAPMALSAERAVAVRLGFGSGEEVAGGRFRAAREVDLAAGRSRRRRREEELRPQERIAALLAGRERLDACETLLLRARADLDAGREREAALQLRAGLDPLLHELRGAVDDPAHAADMAALGGRRAEADAAAAAAAADELKPAQAHGVAATLELAERVLRRRRVLRG